MPQKEKPRQRSARKLATKLVLLGVVGLVAGIGGAAAAVALRDMSLITQVPIEDGFADEDIAVSRDLRLPELTRPVNILLLGTKVLAPDLGDWETVDAEGYHAQVNSLEGRTDVMLLLRFDPQQRTLTVLSIPRDTYAQIRGRGQDKLNAANVYGGASLTARSVTDVLGGVPVDRYVRVNIQGVERLIDALGGVTMDVPTPMRYQDDSQRLYINLNAGEQHLDGAKAVQFLRFRQDAHGDIGRIQRQQMFMRALKDQALTPQTLLRLPDIISVIRSHLDTNLSVQELAALANFATNLDRNQLQMLMLPGEFNGAEVEVSYWLPSYRQIDQLVAQYFDGDTGAAPAVSSSPRFLRVSVQDSTRTPAAADTVIDHLYSLGYTNASTATANRATPLETTRIVAQGGNLAEAQQLQQMLGFGEVLVETTGTLYSDITIQLGEDWQKHLVADVEPTDWDGTPRDRG